MVKKMKRTDLYYETVKEKSMEKYLEFTNKDANNDVFEIPNYIK